MIDDRATNPYDADGWTGEIEITAELTGVLNAAVSTLLIGPDPRRLYLLLAYDSAAGSTPLLWPYQQDAAYGISGDAVGAVLIHNASYPSLVQMAWYAYVQLGPVSYRLITGRDIR
jgi:hypothetical protein